jgi:hypothetical protein
MILKVAPFRFLSLPALIQAPRDILRERRGDPRRRIFEVEDELLLAPYIANTNVGPQLNFPEAYRQELSEAFSEVFLLRDNAAVESYMNHRPLREFRDPARLQRARASCNGQNPVLLHLNPVLTQLGIPLI